MPDLRNGRADEDNNGTLNAEEFARALHSPLLNLRLAPGQTAQLMEAIDLDRNGRIDYKEFLPTFREMMVQAVSDSLGEKEGGWMPM